MPRKRDWENLLWNVWRGPSVLFVGPELGGSRDAQAFPLCLIVSRDTGLERSRRAAPIPKRVHVGPHRFRGPNSPLMRLIRKS